MGTTELFWMEGVSWVIALFSDWEVGIVTHLLFEDGCSVVHSARHLVSESVLACWVSRCLFVSFPLRAYLMPTHSKSKKGKVLRKRMCLWTCPLIHE